MAATGSSRRYAKALFQLAEENQQVDAVRGELGALADLVDENGELAGVLLRPLHPVEQRRQVLLAVAERLQAGSLLRRFCQVLIDHRRLVHLATIRDEFERLADARTGVERAQVRSASALSTAQQERLRSALAARLGRQVTLELSVDPALLGGVVAQVGDLVFDGSLRTQLRQLRSALTSSN